MKVFEKFAAFIFLILLVGLIAFLTYVEVPEGSKQLISAIIGGLMLSAAQALPRLFGVEDNEKDQFKERVRKLENEYVELKIEHTTLKKMHDALTETLVSYYVRADEHGLKVPRRIEEGK